MTPAFVSGGIDFSLYRLERKRPRLQLSPVRDAATGTVALQSLQSVPHMEDARCDRFGKATYDFCWLQFRFASITRSRLLRKFSSTNCTATTLVPSVTTSAARSAARS